MAEDTGFFSADFFHPDFFDTGETSEGVPVPHPGRKDIREQIIREDNELLEIISTLAASGILED